MCGMDTAPAEVYSLPVGAYVTSVTEGSCADAAGLQSGDIITGLGEYSVESYTDLVAALKKFTAGDSTTLTVYRAGSETTLNITLDEKPRQEQTESTEEQQTQEGAQPMVPDNGQQPNFDSDMFEEWYNYFFGNQR